MSKISYSCERYGCYEVYKIEDETKNILIQTDWDYPGLANSFGWQACKCGSTDGTVDCEHKTATQMISEAADYLDSHEGMIINDPGYFD